MSDYKMSFKYFQSSTAIIMPTSIITIEKNIYNTLENLQFYNDNKENLNI